ncbi:MAG: efflux transporter outer membrane subunit [Rikenellaceae bacterium]
MKNWFKIFGVGLSALYYIGAVGCSGARFVEPKVEMPAEYLNTTPFTDIYAEVDPRWWHNFADPMLDSLVSVALENNRDLEILYSRVVESRLQLKNARAALAPTFSLDKEAEGEKLPSESTVQSYTIEPTISWELDLFGKLRYAAVASRAEMMAERENMEAMKMSLVAEVATAYFSILEYDLSLRISEQTLTLRKEAFALTSLLAIYGEATALTLAQNRALVATAQVAVESYRMARNQAIMSLSTTLGDNPKYISVDGRKLLDYDIPKEVPVGLPSALLMRRRDIREAYYTLEAAYGDVGVAIANRFATVTLTGEGGLISSTVKDLFRGNPFGWTATLDIVQPIFTFGRNKRAVEIAKQKREQSLLSYENSVITALSEVESALVGVESYARQRVGQSQLVKSNRIYEEFTSELYKAGEVSYLDVIDAQREYFSAQLSYASLLSSQLSSYVTLYKALGGGY